MSAPRVTGSLNALPVFRAMLGAETEGARMAEVIRGAQ